MANVLTLSGSTTLIHVNHKSVAGTLTIAGTALVLQVELNTNTGAATFSGTLATAMGHGIIASGAFAPTGQLARGPGQVVAGAATFAGALVKRVGLATDGEALLAGSLTPLKLFNVIAAGVLTLSGTVARTLAQSLAGTLTVAGSLVKRAGKLITGALTFLSILRQGIGEAPCDFTLAELRARVYERLDDDATYYTATEVDRALNAAQNWFAMLTLAIERTASFTTVGATCFHTVVDQLTDYLVPLRVTTAAGVRVRPATVHQLDGLSSTWRAVVGTPTRYIAMGYDLIGFTPQYAAPTAITITYAASPTQLTADMDLFEIPPEQQIHLVDFAIWWLRVKEGGEELQSAAMYLQRFIEAADKYGRFVRARSYGQKYDNLPFDLASFDHGRLDVVLPRPQPIRKAS